MTAARKRRTGRPGMRLPRGKRRALLKRKWRLRRNVRAAGKSGQTPEQSVPAQAADNGGYDKGYADGLYDGGERCIDAHHPADLIFPDLTVESAVAAGLAALRPAGLPLLSPAQVAVELEASLRERRPYAFVRLGDGELLTLGQEVVLPIDEVRKAGAFLPYSGVHVLDAWARDTVANSLRAASLVGVPLSRKVYFQPLLFKALQAHGIDCRSLHMTTSTMNYNLYESGLLWPLLEGRRVLVVGNVAVQLAETLAQRGIVIAGAVTPVNGIRDIWRVLAVAVTHDFDLALVAAGIAAIPICVHLAADHGKVAIDFGHLANIVAGVPRV